MNSEFVNGYAKVCFKVLGVFCITIITVALIRHYQARDAFLLIPMIWCLGAGLPSAGEQSFTAFTGLTKQKLIIGFKYYLLSSLIIFPIVAGIYLLYLSLGMPNFKYAGPSGITIGAWMLYQFVLVALFEELFFRSYLQKQVEKISSAVLSHNTWIFWFPVVVSALLFAIAHMVVESDFLKIATFFPGLLFAWLWARTGTLIAPVLSHASANIFARLLLENFR